MPKIGNSKSISEEKCPRCGSKRRVSKAWVETIKTDHGTMTLKHTQTVCTNKECQAEFDRVLSEETEKREKLKKIRDENSAKRKEAKAAR